MSLSSAQEVAHHLAWAHSTEDSMSRTATPSRCTSLHPTWSRKRQDLFSTVRVDGCDAGRARDVNDDVKKPRLRGGR